MTKTSWTGLSENRYTDLVFRAGDITAKALPEWQYLFTREEWKNLNLIDREEIKRIVVSYSLWGDACELTTIFPGYVWRKEAVSTRLKLLLYGFDKAQMPRVDRFYYNDRQVFALYETWQSDWVQVFPVDDYKFFPLTIRGDRLEPSF